MMNFNFNDRGNISVTFSILFVLLMLGTGLIMWVVNGPLIDQFYDTAHDNEAMMNDDNLNSLDFIYAIFSHPLLALLFTALIYVIVVATRAQGENQEEDF